MNFFMCKCIVIVFEVGDKDKYMIQ